MNHLRLLRKNDELRNRFMIPLLLGDGPEALGEAVSVS